MIKQALIGTALVVALASPASARTSTYFGFQIGITNAPPPPHVVYYEEPEMVYVPSQRVYVVEDDFDDCDVFRYGNGWYACQDGYWYRAPRYGGPYRVIDVRYVPRPIFYVPTSHWKHRYSGGAHYRGHWSDGPRYRDRYRSGHSDRSGWSYRDRNYRDRDYRDRDYRDRGHRDRGHRGRDVRVRQYRGQDSWNRDRDRVAYGDGDSRGRDGSRDWDRRISRARDDADRGRDGDRGRRGDRDGNRKHKGHDED